MSEFRVLWGKHGRFRTGENIDLSGVCMRSAELDRRTFLARLGLIGVVAGSGVALPSVASADTRDMIAQVRRHMDALTLDTYSGLAAFVVPGRDAHSRAQGTPRREPGAIAARAPEFLIHVFDHFLPIPSELASGIAKALASGLADVPIPMADSLPDLPADSVSTLDGAVRAMLIESGTLPLAQVIALLLNYLATAVNPAVTQGQFLSPFSRLSAAEKAVAFSRLEDPDPELLAGILSQVPEPLRPVVPGLLPFLVGGLLAFPAFATYSEWPEFDQERRSVRRRPVGWDLSRFDPGVLDGWPEFRGYYQGRREVCA